MHIYLLGTYLHFTYNIKSDIMCYYILKFIYKFKTFNIFKKQNASIYLMDLRTLTNMPISYYSINT